jgi:hypothetical protein
LWLFVAISGAFLPTLLSLFQQGDNPEFYFFGILIMIAALSYRIAHPRPITLWERVVAIVFFLKAILWSLDTASGFLFDVQINYPWWGIIDFSLLFLMFLNSFIQGLTEKTGSFAYVRKPMSFQDLVATVFGGCFVTTAVEHNGKFYGFRKGKLIELVDFDPTKYDRRNISVKLAERVVANVGKPWRPWRNCVVIHGGVKNVRAK